MLADVREGASTPWRPRTELDAFVGAPSGLVGSPGVGRTTCEVDFELLEAAELGGFVVDLDYADTMASAAVRGSKVTPACRETAAGPLLDLGAAQQGSNLSVSASLQAPGWVAPGPLFVCRFELDDPSWLPTSQDFSLSLVEARGPDLGPLDLAPLMSVGAVACEVSGTTTTLPRSMISATTSTSVTTTSTASSTTSSSTSSTLFGSTTTLPTGPVCGDPTGGGVTATDALYVLSVVVRTKVCANCVCDVDASGRVAATDALILLRLVTGQSVGISCPPCAP